MCKTVVAGGIPMRLNSVILSFLLLTLWFQLPAYSEPSFLCISGQLYKPDGTQVYVGHNACASAKIFGSSACVAGIAYFGQGQSAYVGADACKNAKLSSSWLCVQNHLYHTSGWNQFVGDGCNQAVLAGDNACVGGLLFKPDSTSVYVGINGCSTLTPR
jgi:hypothetical protein